MKHRSVLPDKTDSVWYITVPKQQEFTEPKFHFGEQVQWRREAIGCSRTSLTGRIIGMQFIAHAQSWQYQIVRNEFGPQPGDASEFTEVVEENLIEGQNSVSMHQRIHPVSDWLSTDQAAAQLGISAEQLRKLRRRGLFKVGHHCRDTSVPGSGLPRWQWHLARCEKALAVPPTQRLSRS
ncbi:MAG TPA: hypothetical protein V6C65_15000 [Allocoleopsis sp.]